MELSSSEKALIKPKALNLFNSLPFFHCERFVFLERDRPDSLFSPSSFSSVIETQGIRGTTMASASADAEKKKTTGLPPRRGQVKAQIFESLTTIVVSAVSKVGEALGMRGGGASAGGSSATSSPPPSSYNSDASNRWTSGG